MSKQAYNTLVEQHKLLKHKSQCEKQVNNQSLIETQIDFAAMNINTALCRIEKKGK